MNLGLALSHLMRQLIETEAVWGIPSVIDSFSSSTHFHILSLDPPYITSEQIL